MSEMTMRKLVAQATNDAVDAAYKRCPVNNAVDSRDAALARADEMDKMAERISKLHEAINWALGCDEDFTPPEDRWHGQYWWRTELAARAGLKYDAEAQKYLPLPEPPKEGE